jgi:hypothetical protein
MYIDETMIHFQWFNHRIAGRVRLPPILSYPLPIREVRVVVNNGRWLHRAEDSLFFINSQYRRINAESTPKIGCIRRMNVNSGICGVKRD